MTSGKSHRSLESETAILQSARVEIEEQGILGLRVAEVAARANCSITQIYRYFTDRNGLLARVLGDIYEETLERSFQSYYNRMKALDVITIDDIVNSLVLPSQYAEYVGQDIRLQILAASATNQVLKERIKEISQSFVPKWNEGLDYIEAHLEKGVKIDRRIFTIMLLLQTMYYRSLLDDVGFTDEEYIQFIKDKLVL
jgi:AcrR family transcriptional regulator